MNSDGVSYWPGPLVNVAPFVVGQRRQSRSDRERHIPAAFSIGNLSRPTAPTAAPFFDRRSSIKTRLPPAAPTSANPKFRPQTDSPDRTSENHFAARFRFRIPDFTCFENRSILLLMRSFTGPCSSKLSCSYFQKLCSKK